MKILYFLAILNFDNTVADMFHYKVININTYKVCLHASL